MGFGKTKMRYLPIMKADLKKLLLRTAWYYNRRASQFQQTFKMYARVLAESLMCYRECRLFLAINRN